jgi:hypothetical protein
MANTYVKIGSTVTVGAGGASSIDFTSIPATYTDLKIVFSGRDGTGQVYGDGSIRFNNNTGSNYSRRRLLGNGSGVSSGSETTTSITGWNSNGANSTANTFCNVEIYIPNYLSSSQKSVSIDCVVENNGTEGYDILVAGLWNQTAAINQVSIINLTSNFVQYSTASLYGIKKN